MKLNLASTAAVLATAAVAAKDERTFAVLRFTNKQLTISRTDPIVNPGEPSTHVHHIVGGSNFGMSSTGEELMNSKCTNAKIKGDELGLAQQQTYVLGPGPGYGHKQGSSWRALDDGQGGGSHSFGIQDSSSRALDGGQVVGWHRFGGMLGGDPQIDNHEGGDPCPGHR